MALSKKVVTFSLNTSAGNQSITGVGFQPKLVILFCNGTGSVQAGNGFSSLGAATSSTARWAIGQWHTDGAAASETARSARTDKILDIPKPDGSASDYQADLVSMDSDGFTINIGTTVGVALRCVALCLGGTDLDVAVGSFNTGTTAGAGITAVSGLAFQPKAVLTALATTSASVSATTRQSIGFASGSANEWGAALYENDNNLTMVTSHGWSDARYINSSVNTSDDTDIAFNAFTSDGWTHDITTTPASWLVCYIAFGGSAQYYVGNDAQKATAGTEPTTGVGFTPSALITNMGLRTTTGYDADGDFYFHVGFMDGTAEAGGHVFSDDGTANAEVSRGIDETYSLFAVTDDATPTVAAKASLTSFDSDGFTVNWNVADATARLFGFLAIGAASGGTVESGVGSSAGSATASGVGASTAASTGSSAGSATASGVGASTAAAAGSSAGTSTASAVGDVAGGVQEGAGTAAGAATASGVGASTAAAAGTSTGSSTASGVGESVGGVQEGAGTSAGTSTATGAGASTAAAAGTSAGSSTATAVGTDASSQVEAASLAGLRVHAAREMPLFFSMQRTRRRTSRASSQRLRAA